MSLINLITMCAFVVAVLGGVMALTVQDMRKNQPHARISTRMRESFQLRVVADAGLGKFDGDLFKVNKCDSIFTRFFGPKISRLRTVAGKSGLRIVIAAAILGELLAIGMVDVMPLPQFIKPLLVMGMPVFFLTKAYNFLVGRFRRCFLDGFPDLIDLIVRAVRAGVPVTHVITTTADECPEPLKSEFRVMSDSLQVGLDLEEVLTVAMRRIEIADFSFFCVCLLLQRETGGQFGETLENLSNIVRTCSEIRSKTKVLTSEARITTKILTAVPICIVGSMYFLNHDYLMVLINTEAGQKLMTFATISIAIGLMVIQQDFEAGYVAMNPDQIQTLTNLVMLFALFAGLAVWWMMKHGGQRGRIAERARTAATSERADLVTTSDDEMLSFRERTMRRLARIGDKLPLFDAKYRLKLQKELVRGGYRSNMAVSVLLASKFCVGLVFAVLTVILGSDLPLIGTFSPCAAWPC
ncbi:Flp pilus assembly protein TadB [Candidatus Paraburkholderia calva]|nr:Flp pilus assembly protein TadB [Candidatus Paraburkholderia calva]